MNTKSSKDVAADGSESDDLTLALDAFEVAGVQLATTEAAIRYSDRRDLVAIALAPQSRAAAVFTRNAFRAAPVLVASEHLAATAGKPRLLLINTGNANAGTGEAGMAAAKACCAAAAAQFGVDVEEVLPFSTGVIGEDLPVDRIEAALPALHASLEPTAWIDAGWGILTTDTRPKIALRSFEHEGRSFRIAGIAKGAGMLRPDMATMLGFLCTDAAIERSTLEELLGAAVDRSFHRITVDGDTSTNDAVVLAATGAAGNPLMKSGPDSEMSSLREAFSEALTSLCIELAQGLVRDGEGATRFIEVEVAGGRTAQECLDVAFTIAHSPLVKTALYAADANWGRILMAIGRSPLVDLDVNKVSIAMNGITIAEHGSRAASYRESDLEASLNETDITVRVELNRGNARETVWTSDLSHDYVRINAEYRS
ncbi:MAG: bifunctional glutamate N-acetyltransferase/amino-acid acetyltransferase ArgJ [Pseudomonadota bacterium]